MDILKKLYWTAGFLEGEGWFGVSQKGSGYAAITVVQVQREPLERLKEYFGGYIVKRQKPSSDRHSQAYAWMVNGVKAAGLMMTLYPLMSPKRQRKILATLGAWRAAPVYSGLRVACPKGHPYSGVNSCGGRICKLCCAENNRKYEKRKRMAALVTNP